MTATQEKNGEYQLAFEVTRATVHQKVKMLKDISEEQLIQGLKRGRYETTMDHAQDHDGKCIMKIIDVDDGFSVIGYVLSQDVSGDFCDYR